MIITFIGFSGSGKSYWAKRLRDELEYNYYCCDDEVARMLSDILHTELHGTADLAKWMGRPDNSEFDAREAKYLELENASLEKFCVLLERDSLAQQSAVLATTGSFVYCRSDLKKSVSEQSLVVYLEVDPQHVEQSFEVFRNDPKPLVWDNKYFRQDNESDEVALERSFFELMASRRSEYEEIAEVTIPYAIHKSKGLSVADLLSEIAKSQGG